jgi:hypothetical protein
MSVKTAPRLLLRPGIITLVPGPPAVSAGLTVSARAGGSWARSESSDPEGFQMLWRRSRYTEFGSMTRRIELTARYG